MREIKFRAWNKTEKKMYQMEVFSINNPEVEFLQFTGLKDKNGKEIYEGDICTIADGMMYSKSVGTMVAGKYLVYWNDDRWGLKDSNGDDYDTGDYYRGDDINNWNESEIIGNIYENPDLLQG
jgi:uncharacterized phage protein (TIGR01671 family)